MYTCTHTHIYAYTHSLLTPSQSHFESLRAAVDIARACEHAGVKQAVDDLVKVLQFHGNAGSA